MLLQRLTNLLPSVYGAHDLFFIRLKQNSDGKTRMTKELHLSQIHNPYNNRLDETFCQRWVSISGMNKVKKGIRVDAQVSEYLDHGNKYFCISISQAGNFEESGASSVTIGMLITPELRANLNFLKDEGINHRLVHTTCERCPIEDCKERKAPNEFIQKKRREDEKSVC